MYSNFYPYSYPYGYKYDYGYDVPEFRQPNFSNLVGQFYTLPHRLTLPNGQLLHRGTRVFIYRVRFNQAGLQLVTIVFPENIGGNCVASLTQVPADQLGGEAAHQYQQPMNP